MLADLFLASLFLYLAGMLIDLFEPGIVSRAFNLTILLGLCLGAGIFSILLGHPEETAENEPTIFHWIFTCLLSIGSGIMIWQAMVSSSSFALLFGGTGAMIVFFACFAMMKDD